MAAPDLRPREKGDADWLRSYNQKGLGKRHTRILDVKRHGGVHVARTLPEELCHDEAPRQLRTEFEKVLADGEVRHLVVDLSSVNYVASAVVGTMLWLNQAVSARAGKVHLCGVHWRVHELFELCQLYRLIPAHPRVEDAVEAAKVEKG